MKGILFGATGMVGQRVLRECLLDSDVTEVLSVAAQLDSRCIPRYAGRSLGHAIRHVPGLGRSDVCPGAARAAAGSRAGGAGRAGRDPARGLSQTVPHWDDLDPTVTSRPSHPGSASIRKTKWARSTREIGPGGASLASTTTVELVGPPSVSRVGRKITYGRRLSRMGFSARVMSSNIFLCVARVMTERSSDTPCAWIALSPAPSHETKMNRLRDLRARSSWTRFRTQAVITGLDEPMADRTNRHPSTAA